MISLAPHNQELPLAKGLELVISVPPASYPVTLEHVMEYAAGVGACERALFERLVASATESVEAMTGLSIASKTLKARWESVYCVAALPAPPVVNILEVNRIEVDGSFTLLAQGTDYLIKGMEKVEIHLGTRYSLSGANPSTIEVEYEAGYAGESAIPAPIRQAIAMLVATLYENREDFVTGTIARELPWNVQRLVAPYAVI